MKQMWPISAVPQLLIQPGLSPQAVRDRKPFTTETQRLKPSGASYVEAFFCDSSSEETVD